MVVLLLVLFIGNSILINIIISEVLMIRAIK